MRVDMWLDMAVKRLGATGHEEPRAAAEFLLSHRLGCGRMDLFGRLKSELADERVASLETDLARLVQGEPLQYVVGDVDFLGRLFKVDRRALIPRPETETLTEAVLKDKTLWTRPSPVVTDVGTGTGCIAVTLCLLRPQASVEAVDISPRALELARENAAFHGVEERIRFRQGDLLAGYSPASLDLMVSNPPYVPTVEWTRLPASIRQYEPRTALDGGADGLATISRLVEQAAIALKPGGCIYMEVGEDQGERVTGLLMKYGFVDCDIRSDLCGHERITIGRRS